MTRDQRQSSTRRTPALAGWLFGLVLIAAVMVLAGVGMAAVLAQRGAAADWSRWSDVGQTFGALGSIISGLTLVALVVTARFQFREMQENRKELEYQRLSLMENNSELKRASTAAFRRLHLEILKMSIDDPLLAAVWPPIAPDVSPELNKQYLYANIIYQFQFASLRGDGYSDEQVLATLRHLFTSAVMRDYWKSAARGRETLPAESPEYIFAKRVDEVCREFDAVAASARRPAAEGPMRVHERLTPEQAA